MPKQDHFSRALYTIDIGQNDITHSYVLNMTQVEIKLFIPSILDKLSMTIKDIYGEGGRFFRIHNTAPLGCLHYLLDRIPPTQHQMDKTGCSHPVNEVAQFFNSRLNGNSCSAKKGPSFSYIYICGHLSSEIQAHQPSNSIWIRTSSSSLLWERWWQIRLR
ncbi:GDSL esterase/lipase [Acorus calamus]|uniref:GDSL esterase/lipase n=1 Tax=Acorus calamus TaxID=4465 RepID=A0AAV9D2J6_ACOCL|nr:GDSL esterase/lipase [Acorus calamus]